MSDVYAKLKELGLELPKAPAKGGVYSSSRMFAGNLVYISGCGPVIDGQVAGKVGREFTKEEAYVFSRNSMLNVLAVLQDRIGEQPYVANGGSQLLVDLFGEEAGAPTRSAVGMNVLPGNIPVETEAIFEIEE